MVSARKFEVRKLFLILILSAIIFTSSVFASSAYSPSPQLAHATRDSKYPKTLMSSNAQSGGYFGGSVAISGKLAVVGAPSENADGYDYAGHAYVFSASTGKLLQNLTSPNAQEGGSFGNAVAISGKLAIVGAPGETADGNSSAGHAYVFSESTGKLITTLTSPNAQEGGYFGYAVAISGKLAIVGAPYETANGYDYAGHAYVFSESTGKLITTLTSPNAQSAGIFGYAVAIGGKLAVVGAFFETADGESYAGHAYVFSASTGKLITTLTSPNAQYQGYFGGAVAISGKFAIVGAYGETGDGYYEAGHAYVFSASTGKLLQNLTSPNAQERGYFGFAVGISGKLAIVGAFGETADGYSSAGHAYVFGASTGRLLQNLTSPNAQEYGIFGASVSISGKLAVVGAPGETADGYTGAGHAYLFKK